MSDSIMSGDDEGGLQAAGYRSMAVGGNVGVAITGDGAQVVMLPAEAVRWAREVEAPPGAGNLPGSASGLFVGRDKELAKLRRLLIAEAEAAVTQVSRVQAIHGLGGIGKSTLALHYAHIYRHTYTLAWWINASNTEQIVTSLATLATRLCPHWAATAGVQERAAWAVLWLQWHPGWLLVFDNVEDPTDLRHYLGALPDGHHLTTSRTATGWHAIAPTMALGLFDADSAATLLCTLALGSEHTPTPKERQDAADLAAELGYLPLALEQAGAYLFETGTSLPDYQVMLGQVMDTAAGGINPERTVARIWRHTLTAIERRNPQAVTLLNAMAWLAPDAIPRSLLATLCPVPLALGEALGILHAYNMVAFSGPEVSIHRLVQAVLRSLHSAPGSPPPGRADAERILRIAFHPDSDHEPAPSDRWQHLIPHLIALAVTSPSGSHRDQALPAYQTAAHHLTEERQELRAIPLFQVALAQFECTLGRGHPDALQSRDRLADAYYMAMDYDNSIPLYAENLVHRQRDLGASHADTLNNSTKLAHAYRMAGRPEQAIPLYRETLSKRLSMLGENDPDTLHVCIGLAGAYKWAGYLNRAISLFESTLSKYEQTLGATHSRTLHCRDQLAGAYGAARNFEQAIPLFERNLAQCEQGLGNGHPLTLRLRNNLADAYQSVGDLEQAIPLFQRVLNERHHLLGDAHPDTLQSRNNLAHAYQAAGDLGRAIPLYEANFALWQQMLGNAHPQALASREHLARAHQAAQAVQQRRAATTTTEAPQGPSAPD